MNTRRESFNPIPKGRPRPNNLAFGIGLNVLRQCARSQAGSLCHYLLPAGFANQIHKLAAIAAFVVADGIGSDLQQLQRVRVAGML